MFTFHHDPGHGWLEVTQTDLNAIGMRRTDFSRYSYSNGKRYFLEEDCDASKFADAWEAKNGRKIELKSVYHDHGCFIRNLPGLW